MTVLKYWDQASATYKTISGPPGPVGPPSFPDAVSDGKTYGRMNAAWNPVLPIAGGTLTGAAIFPSNAVTTGNPSGLDGIRIDGPAGSSGLAITGQRAGSIRWRMVLGNSTAEGGSNAGSDFTLARYTDAGAFINNSIIVTRSSGLVTLGNALAIPNGNLSMGSAVVASPTDLSQHIALYGTTYGFSITSGNLNIVAGSTYVVVNVGGALNLTSTAVATIGAYSAAGSNASHLLSVAGQRSWQMYETPAGAFRIWDSVNGDDFLIDTAGNLTLAGAATVTGALNTTGQINAAGNVAITGTDAYCFMTANGVRAWYLHAMSNGNWRIVDNSAGTSPFVIAGGTGVCSFVQPITAPGINCSGQSSMGAGGIIYARWDAGKAFSFSNSGTALTFYVNQAATGTQTFGAPSDERVKRNIGPAEGDALAELCQIKLISFDENFFGAAHIAHGFSAQQLRTAIPEAVTEVEYFHGPEDKRPTPVDDGIMLGVDLMPVVARLVGAVQQLSTRLAALEGGR